MLGNTPRSFTVIRLERAKSFAFEIRFVDGEGMAVDVVGATIRVESKQPARLGGASVLSTTADMTRAAEGVGLVALQATDTDLDPAEYPFDITIIDANGYSQPLLKGAFDVGDNTDSNTANTYSQVNLANGIEVVLWESNIVSVRLDGFAPNEVATRTYVDEAIDAVALEVLQGGATTAYVDAAVADKATTAYVDAAVADKATTAYVDTAVGDKATTAYVDTAVGDKATTAYVDTAVGDKATTAYVDQQDAALLAPADVLAGANITVAVANGQVTISGQAGGGGGANPTSFSATEPDAATYGFWAET